MASHRIVPPWDYLREASDPSLESFELSRLNHAANLRKEVGVLLEQWIAEMSEAFLARFLRQRRKSPTQADPSLDILPQAELPFSPPQAVSARPRRADRRPRAQRGSPVL